MVGCTSDVPVVTETPTVTETPDVIETPDAIETKEEPSEEPIVLEKIEATQLDPHSITLTSEISAYANPDTSSDVLETLNDSAMVIGEANDFYQVILANGSIAYIEKNLFKESSNEVVEEVKEEVKEEPKEEVKEEIKEEKKDEPKQVTIPSEFDAEFYAKNNPDVVAVFGNSPEALYNHYVKYGKKEGRAQNANEVDKREQVAQSNASTPSVPSTPTSPETPSQSAPTSIGTYTDDELRTYVFVDYDLMAKINDLKSQNGLSTLPYGDASSVSDKLTNKLIANYKSITNDGSLSHTLGGNPIGREIIAAYRGSGTDSMKAINSWMNSADHKHILMLDDYALLPDEWCVLAMTICVPSVKGDMNSGYTVVSIAIFDSTDFKY